MQDVIYMTGAARDETLNEYALVLIRHGESEWNQAGRFTGWADVDLTARGEQQARHAGRLLASTGWRFDCAYTSLLKRSIRTQRLISEALHQTSIPVIRDWRLNERHYGDLTGRSKVEAIEAYGDRQVQEWRRSYRGRPPALPAGDARFAAFDWHDGCVQPERMPRTESLHETVDRVSGFWLETARPLIAAGKRLMICGHGNNFRALIKVLDGLSEDETMALDIPNGAPIVYGFDRELKPRCGGYLEPPAAEESNIL